MLKLNVNQEKQLTFEVQIGGIQSDQVSSFLRIVLDEIEYGFPAKVGNESIVVDLPPLRTITARKLKEGEEVEVKLEIIADGNYLTPWKDTFTISNPLVIEAKIIDDDFNASPAFKTKLVTEEGKVGDQKQGVKVEKVEAVEKEVLSEEDMTERVVAKLAEKLKPMFKKEKTKVVKEQKSEKKKITKEEEVIKDEEVIKENTEPQKQITSQDLKNITEEGVYDYMTRAGTKNPQVQKIIYEQAEIAAGTSIPVNVLMHVVKILKSKK